jgi:hypothetical protein
MGNGTRNLPSCSVCVVPQPTMLPRVPNVEVLFPECLEVSLYQALIHQNVLGML